jgi:hypothetical protein
MKNIHRKSKIYAILLVLFISIQNCHFTVPREQIENGHNPIRQEIDKPTIIIFKYSTTTLSNSPLNQTPESIKNFKICIKSAFLKFYIFKNIQVIQESEELNYIIDNSTSNINLIYLNLEFKNRLNYENRRIIFPLLSILTLGIFPSWQDYNFNVSMRSQIFRKSENYTFSYKFREYFGWLTLPFWFLSEEFLDLRNAYPNSTYPDIEYIIEKSLSKVILKE